MVPKSLSLHAWKLGDKIWSEKQNGYLGFQETVHRGLESKLFSWYVGELKFTLTFVWLGYWMSSEAKLTLAGNVQTIILKYLVFVEILAPKACNT